MLCRSLVGVLFVCAWFSQVSLAVEAGLRTATNAANAHLVQAFPADPNVINDVFKQTALQVLQATQEQLELDDKFAILEDPAQSARSAVAGLRAPVQPSAPRVAPSAPSAALPGPQQTPAESEWVLVRKCVPIRGCFGRIRGYRTVHSWQRRSEPKPPAMTIRRKLTADVADLIRRLNALGPVNDQTRMQHANLLRHAHAIVIVVDSLNQ